MEPDDSMAKRYEKGGDNMAMPKDTIYSEMNKAWEIYLEALENSLDTLEKEIEEAKKMAGVCTNEWCAAIEHVPSVSRDGPIRTHQSV